VVDFAGSAPQVEGNLNANEAIALSAVFYVFRSLGGEAMPTNAGCLRPLELRVPDGSILKPRPPAAVAAGNVETSQRIVDVLLRALAKALPGRIPAASQGTMNNLVIAGFDPRRGRPFTYYETLGGGTGAFADLDGASAIHSHMTNTRNTPIESLESYYPLRVNAYGVRERSGGRGRRRGGDGLVREIELLAPAELAFIGERQSAGPWGLAGGGSGAPGRVFVIEGGKKRRLSGKVHLRLPAGARIRIETPGGGAFGSAKPRRPH
jgi:N-methylhydantoinase B